VNLGLGENGSPYYQVRRECNVAAHGKQTMTPGKYGYQRMLRNDHGRASSPVSDHPAR
jgi:hypothetical protein